MIRKMDLQDTFVAGVGKKLIQLRWGAQKRVVKATGISPSYLNDILKKRKRAPAYIFPTVLALRESAIVVLIKGGQRHRGSCITGSRCQTTIITAFRFLLKGFTSNV
jgi:hypothetical protein